MPIGNLQREKLKVLGERVKALRNSKGLTLKQLSYAIGKDPQSIHRLEVGEVNPSYLYLLDICKGLDIELSELMTSI